MDGAILVVDASTGPMPIRSGSQPLTAIDLIRANGSSPCSAANSSEHTSTIAAPSVSGEEVPAVTGSLGSAATTQP